jgi:hypothetical protein
MKVRVTWSTMLHQMKGVKRMQKTQNLNLIMRTIRVQIMVAMIWKIFLKMMMKPVLKWEAIL